MPTDNTPYYADESVTLYLGDCREITDWLKADVLVTDPPYGLPGGRHSWHKRGIEQVHADATWDDLVLRDAALTLWGDRPRAIFGSPKMQEHAPAHRGAPLIWDKGASPGMGDHTWPFGTSYEVIWINGDGWAGSRRSSVIKSVHLPTAARAVGHPTPKPVGLMETLIAYAPPGVIADPFAGSGSTLVAAKQLGRKAIGVELDEAYCEIAARRLSQGVLDFGGVA